MKRMIGNGLLTFVIMQAIITVLQFLLGPISILISFITSSGKIYNTALCVIAFLLKFAGVFVFLRIKNRDNRNITLKFFIATLSIAVMIQFIVALIFGFSPFIVGEEILTIAMKWSHADVFSDVPTYIFLALYPVNVLCIFGAGISAFFLAKRKQKKEREELIGKTGEND